MESPTVPAKVKCSVHYLHFLEWKTWAFLGYLFPFLDSHSKQMAMLEDKTESHFG